MEALFQGELVNTRRIIYTPSDFARTNLLHLQEVGELKARKPHISSRKHLISYLFFIILDGEGALTYGGSRYELEAGDCVFIDCAKEYSHVSSQKLWTLKWVHFYGPNMKGIYEKYAQRGGMAVFKAKEPERFVRLLDELYDTADSGDYIRDMHIFEQLATLTALLMSESWHPEYPMHMGAKRRSLQSIKDYLDQNYREKITLDTLAETFYINKFYLARIFKEQFGVSINRYLAQIRVTHAKQLLRFYDLSVEQVGSRCGIDEPAYFARVFKKVEGITPGQYRRMW